MARAGRLVRGTQATILIAAAVMAAKSLALADHAGTLTFSNSSRAEDVLSVVAGASLIVAGVVALQTSSRRGFGILLCAGGTAWFASGWNDPDVGSAVLFTAGLAGSVVASALIAHAGLVAAKPEGRSAADWLLIAVGYFVTLGSAGIVPALLSDPAGQGCHSCPTNLLHVWSDLTLSDRFGRAGLELGAAWTAAVVVALVVRTVRAPIRRRWATVSITLPAAAFLLAAGLVDLRSAHLGFVGDDSTDRRLQGVEATALIVLALGTAWVHVERRLTRAAVTRLVIEAAGAPPIGGLERSLGKTLGDSTLRILYPLSDGRLVDGSGSECSPPANSAVTQLARGELTVALIAHREGLFDRPGAQDDVAQTARLALTNERLQAEAQARLADLQASRARIVTEADSVRRRLERDLHDGAQQRMVALSIALRLANGRLGPGPSPIRTRLDRAQAEVAIALGELRALARGIYPRELADEGLAAALEVLAETAPVPLALRSLPDRRYAADLESAAYFVVAFCCRAPDAHLVSIDVTNSVEGLRIRLETDALPLDLSRVEDRVTALRGSVAVSIEGSVAAIRVVLPCGS
jgi:signal transduction histidine kinase